MYKILEKTPVTFFIVNNEWRPYEYVISYSLIDDKMDVFVSTFVIYNAIIMRL